MERYRIVDMLGSLTIDEWVFLSSAQKGKTHEQFHKEFQQKWRGYLVSAFPIPQEGETMQELVEKGELYQRPHAELYTITFDPTNSDDSRKSLSFMIEAKRAGLQIEAAVPIDTSKPWYRRILRREPREMTVDFVLVAPPRSTSPTTK